MVLRNYGVCVTETNMFLTGFSRLFFYSLCFIPLFHDSGNCGMKREREYYDLCEGKWGKEKGQDSVDLSFWTGERLRFLIVVVEAISKRNGRIRGGNEL